MSGARCYIASPHGFSEAGRIYYYGTLLPALSEVVEVVDPWILTSAEEFAAAARRRELEDFVVEVGNRNAAAIRDSRLLVACLDGADVDSGTASEVGYACALGLTCFGLRSDLRETGERGAIVNLQVQSFISMSGGRVCDTLEELREVLRSIPRP